ncbi:hypothetical protein V5F59_17585 [Xanthobacter autotrophicus DSM 431]
MDDSDIGREFGVESFNDHFDVKSVMVSTEDKPFDGDKGTSEQPRLD